MFLVRDLRDLLASRLAFNRRTGKPQFGFDRAASPEEYVRGRMRTEAETWWRPRCTTQARIPAAIRGPDPAPGGNAGRVAGAELGLDSGEDAVTGTLERTRALAPDRQAGHKTSADEAASIGRWRNDLTPELQAACEEVFRGPPSRSSALRKRGTGRPGRRETSRTRAPGRPRRTS